MKPVTAATCAAVVLALLVAGGLGVLTLSDRTDDARRENASARETSADPGPAADGAPRLFCGDRSELARDLRAVERRRGARVGVHVLDPRTGASVGYRHHERFGFASTFKVLAAAAVLERTDREDLGRRLTWTAADLVDHSPVTERHVTDGLTLRRVIDAAVTQSDNTAANLLLEVLGGPAGLQRSLAAAGDRVIRVDRWETELNDFTPGDDRDTTTPAAAARTLATYVLGARLAAPERALLVRLMERGTAATSALVREAVPDEWVAAGKTGAGSYGTRNFVALAHRPGERPLVVAVFTRHLTPDAPPADELVVEASHVLFEGICR